MTMNMRTPVLTALLGGAALATVIATPAIAQEGPPTNGWFKVCSKQEDNEICNVQFQSVASNGQVVTAISLAEIKGKINRRIFQITVPTGRLLPAGIKVKVDDKKEVAIPYAYCFPQNCMAEVALDDNLVSLLKSGKGMTVTSTNFQSKPNPVQITLEGFTGAYDGEPLKRDELESRQRQLQDELAQEGRRTAQEAPGRAGQGQVERSSQLI